MNTQELNNIIANCKGTCIVCYNELTPEIAVVSCDQNDKWELNKYCINCLEYYKSVMWLNYLTNVINADCEKSLKRSVEYPMPYYLTEDLSLNSNLIIKYYHNNQIKSGKLDIKFSEETIENIRLDIIDLKNNIENDSNFDYLSEIYFITERYNLFEYKKKVI